ncbi:MAG: phosphopyruvate hydratase, partial [Legionellales bacterium]|nr:phosphopyruvate hydratase [Legionellales bacterium]
MAFIESIKGFEILDSRGNPTIECCCQLSNGITAVAAVPSGASTGAMEAYELRDNDPKRYGGKGVLKAIDILENQIAPKLIGMNPVMQEEIDD